MLARGGCAGRPRAGGQPRGQRWDQDGSPEACGVSSVGVSTARLPRARPQSRTRSVGPMLHVTGEHAAFTYLLTFREQPGTRHDVTAPQPSPSPTVMEVLAECVSL